MDKSLLTQEQAAALAESVGKIVMSHVDARIAKALRTEAQRMLEKMLTQWAAEAVAKQTAEFVDYRIAVALRVGIDAAVGKKVADLSDALQHTTWAARAVFGSARAPISGSGITSSSCRAAPDRNIGVGPWCACAPIVRVKSCRSRSIST